MQTGETLLEMETRHVAEQKKAHRPPGSPH
jgi:hypothetical protein